jgi:hypothetical protein
VGVGVQAIAMAQQVVVVLEVYYKPLLLLLRLVLR